MAIPTYPTPNITRPFASNGSSATIPDTKPGEGRASWQEGFPTETQLPLTNGGVAPSRIDFNGIFKALSALAFWQQSGGEMLYNATLNYQTPCIVYANDSGGVGKLWWCLQSNGPDVVNPGVVAPGTNSAVWLNLADWLFGQVDQGGGGEVETFTFRGYHSQFMDFFEQVPPAGWAIRNGQVLTNVSAAYPQLWEELQKSANSWKLRSETAWQALRTAAGGTGGAPFFVLDTSANSIRLPDTRGDYVRNIGAGTMTNIGQWHGDAIRNINATFWIDNDYAGKQTAGAVYLGAMYYGGAVNNNGSTNFDAYFDASRVVPTATENRTRSFGMLGCVYTGVAAA